MPVISCCFVVGFTTWRLYSYNSCHRFSIGLQSGDSAGVRHQCTSCAASQSVASLDVCFGSLSAIKRWLSGYTLSKNAATFDSELQCTEEHPLFLQIYKFRFCPVCWYQPRHELSLGVLLWEKNIVYIQYYISFYNLYTWILLCSKPWFRSGWFALLPTTEPFVSFKLNWTLDYPYYVVKFILQVCTGPVQAFLFILVSDQLAVSTSSECPTQWLATTKYGSSANTKSACEE